MKILAVVVTYNRLELLKRTISCLKANQGLSGIIVVNNGSTDGTGTWLATQGGLHVITQDNTGGSGGFHTGIQQAMHLGADWIWCMDDDVFPRPDCLQHLLPHTQHPQVGILAPRRLMNGQVFTNDFQSYNLTNPFASMYSKRLAHMHIQAPTPIAGTAFEGLFISRHAVESIGLPNQHLFIFCDDTDYCLRAHLAGYTLLYIPDALMDKHQFFSSDSWATRQRKKKWKRYYQVRNSTYLNHHYGRNAAVRYLRGFNNVAGYIATALLTAPFSTAYTWSDIPRLWRAYTDGLHERLGKITTP